MSVSLHIWWPRSSLTPTHQIAWQNLPSTCASLARVAEGGFTKCIQRAASPPFTWFWCFCQCVARGRVLGMGFLSKAGLYHTGGPGRISAGISGSIWPCLSPWTTCYCQENTIFWLSRMEPHPDLKDRHMEGDGFSRGKWEVIPRREAGEQNSYLEVPYFFFPQEVYHCPSEIRSNLRQELAVSLWIAILSMPRV